MPGLIAEEGGGLTGPLAAVWGPAGQEGGCARPDGINLMNR